MVKYETITVETNGPIATLCLDRADALNALSEKMRLELISALRVLRDNRDLRVLILTGNGRAFCSGADVKEGFISKRGFDLERMLTEEYNVIISELRGLHIPTIAAVNGIAAGAGCSLALACDFILAAESAQFIQVFSRIGACPDAGSSFFLPRIVGRQRALGMMLTNDPISARTAEEWGIAWKLFPDGSFADDVQKFASTVAKQPTRALVFARRLVDASATSGLEAQMSAEAIGQGVLSKSHDAQEAINAFIEKRVPDFKGN
ncbi:MAG: enoyl-CoA hydratase-related protein [Pseudomonadota bacterium]